jgi:hypothetical protein
VRLYTSWASLDYYGITLEEWRNSGPRQVLHPQDAEIVMKELPEKLQTVRVPLEPQASQRNFRTRLPRNGLAALAGLAGAAELGRLRSLDGFVAPSPRTATVEVSPMLVRCTR